MVSEVKVFDMRALLIAMAIFLSSLVNGQKTYFELLFNGVLPVDTSLGYEYKLSSILNADTITCNAQYWDIVEFRCSAMCDVDWECRIKGNTMTEQLKKHIIGCMLKVRRRKIYFHHIVLQDPTGRRFIIDEYIAIIRK